MNRLFIFLLSWIGISAGEETICAKSEVIPLEILLGNPDRASPSISPNGAFLSFVAPVEGVLNLWVRNIASGEEFPVTNDRHRGIREYRWCCNSSSLFYFMDKNGDENWQIYTVDIQTKAIKAITPFPEVRVQLIEHSGKHPNEIAVLMNKEDRSLFDVYKIDLTTGDFELIGKNPGNIEEWYIDQDFNIVGYRVRNEDASVDIYNKHQKRLIHWTVSENLISGVCGVSRNGKRLYVSDASNSNTARLVAVDVETAQIKVLYENSRYDVAGVIFHPFTREPLAATIQTKYFMVVPLDLSYSVDIEVIAKHLPKHVAVPLVRMSTDGNSWIFVASSDQQASVCYFYDRKSKEVRRLFEYYPKLSKYELASTRPIEFQARDGLLIEGYLTLPNTASKPSPMILFVHGGPQSRDSWGYNSTVQFLANRGYAVMQLNYRGSSGYGVAHLDAGVRQWGNKMQHDLTDGVQWAIDQGIADPKRIAIFGASYGGYAALCGAAFTPDLYAAAIDVCGPSNLISFLNAIPPYWKLYKTEFYTRLGNPETDLDLLKERSPFFSVDKIQIPLLIGQGANDPRVVEAESQQMVHALQERDMPCEYVVYPDEGHGFVRPQSRLDFYQRLERFLAEHLLKDP